MGSPSPDAGAGGAELEDVVALVVGDVDVPRGVRSCVAGILDAARALRADGPLEGARGREDLHLALGAVGHVDELPGRCRADRHPDRRPAALHLEGLLQALPGGCIEHDDAAVAVVGHVDVARGVDARVTWLLELGEARLGAAGCGAALVGHARGIRLPDQGAARGVLGNPVVAGVGNHHVPRRAGRGGRRIGGDDLHAGGIHAGMARSAQGGDIRGGHRTTGQSYRGGDQQEEPRQHRAECQSGGVRARTQPAPVSLLCHLSSPPSTTSDGPHLARRIPNPSQRASLRCGSPPVASDVSRATATCAIPKTGGLPPPKTRLSDRFDPA